MNLRHRITVCALLLLTAALCASYTARGLLGERAAATPVPVLTAPQPEGYTLCAKNGCVAVLEPDSGGRPVITDIELATLREADRSLIESGLTVSSREELLSLLEDLGS